MTSPSFKQCWRMFSGIVAVAATLVLSQSEAIAPLESAVYRGLFQLRGAQMWEERIVLITIDDETLAQIGQFPLPRDYYTQLLEQLSRSRPAVIGFNILFPESSPADAELADAMAKANNIVLASAVDARGYPLLPNKLLHRAAIAIGHILEEPANDGIVYQIQSWQARQKAFGVAIADIYGQQHSVVNLTAREQTLGINWPGAQASLTQYSFIEVLSGQLPPAAFNDKIVLVGLTATGSDPLPTPYDYDPPGSSLLLHAAVIDNILQERSLLAVGLGGWWPLLLLATPAIGYWLFGQSLRWQLAITLGGLLGWASLSVLLFYNLYWLPVVPPLILWGLMGTGAILSQQLLANMTLQSLLEDLWQQYRQDKGLALRMQTPQHSIPGELGPEVRKLVVLANSWGWAQATQTAIAQTVPIGLLAADDRDQIWFCNSLAMEWLPTKPKQSLSSVLVPQWLLAANWQQIRIELAQRRTVSPIECQRGYQWFELRFERLENLRQPNPLLQDGRQGTLMVIENITHRKTIELQLRSLNRGLKNEIRQRTVELETVNLSLLQEVIERQQAQEQLAYLALHDELTGLPNRTQLKTRLQTLVQQVAENRSGQFAVLFIDCDRFKLVNDSFGHLVGDKLLQAIALRLDQSVSHQDLVARFGGDEFVILLVDIQQSRTAIKIAQRIRQQLQEPFLIEDQKLYTGCSIGIVFSNSDYRQADDMLRDADTAMYRAKRAGIGKVLFKPEMHFAVRSSLQLETDLRLSLQHQELIVHYQPIFGINTQTIVGFEALLRWQHPRRGLITPDKFIPLAEETGLIIPIGQWVMQKACQQLRNWQDRRLLQPDAFMSVNLSAQQFNERQLLNRIDKILQETQLESRYLKLEITESAIMANSETAVSTFKALKDRGIHLSIDDFGTGYSSLSYLHCFPIDVLKVDRSFIQRMGQGHKYLSLVRAIKTLAHHFDMTMIAEGIETQTQVEYLRAMKCSLGQGYFFCPPMDYQSLEARYLCPLSETEAR
ncbi:MAG: EAL domain-containing protein [Cyanobacteria bacterium P01_C01_bin.120]